MGLASQIGIRLSWPAGVESAQLSTVLPDVHKVAEPRAG